MQCELEFSPIYPYLYCLWIRKCMKLIYEICAKWNLRKNGGKFIMIKTIFTLHREHLKRGFFCVWVGYTCMYEAYLFRTCSMTIILDRFSWKVWSSCPPWVSEEYPCCSFYKRLIIKSKVSKVFSFHVSF